MLERKNYRVVDIESLILYCYLDQMTVYKMSPKMTRTHENYSSLNSTFTPRNCGNGWITKEQKEVGAEVCELKKLVKELFSFLCLTVVYAMTFHVLCHFA